MIKNFIVTILASVCAFHAYAQKTIELTKLNSPIVLDGVSNEPAWDEVPYLTPVQYEPVFMGEMNEETKFKVGYDENYMYVSGELYTKDPASITTNSLTRDQYSSDDVFAVIIDGFNDNQNAGWFFTNPDGVRFDFAVSNDADFSGGRNAINSSWNTFWDVETIQTKDGWFAEMRIPFSSIGIQVNQSNITEMGIIVYRWITTKNERHIYPAIPPNWNLGNAKPSQAQDVKLEGVQSKNPLYFTPYALSGVTRFSDLNTNETAYEYTDEEEAEIGFDLKYNLTSNLTLDLTVNTDFAQVEADDQQLNLSRFNLFFPEKRQFFQQRSGLFDFSFGRDRVFYSRRIGLDEDGNPVRILGGVRVTGRVGNLDMGFINMQTASNDITPTENFGVLRIKNQAFNERSFIGGILTSRLDADQNYNYVFGVDGDLNLIGDTFFEFRGAASQDSEADSLGSVGISERSSYRLSLRRNANTGVSYQATFSQVGDYYDPELGFVRIGGTAQKFLRVGYGWLSKQESVFQRHSFRFAYFGRFYNNEHSLVSLNDGLQSKFLSFRWGSVFKQFGNFDISISNEEEDIPVGDSFDVLGQIYIPANSYTTNNLEIEYEFSEAWKLAGDVEASVGSLYDGNIREFSISPRVFLSRKFELGGSYRLTHLQFPKQAREIIGEEVEVKTERTTTEFTSHLAQIRAQYAFNKKAVVSAFLQYGNVAERVGANIRFRYNFSEGRDFWLVINEQVNTARNQSDEGLPDLPYIQSGSILIKYNHTFAF